MSFLLDPVQMGGFGDGHSSICTPARPTPALWCDMSARCTFVRDVFGRKSQAHIMLHPSSQVYMLIRHFLSSWTSFSRCLSACC